MHTSSPVSRCIGVLLLSALLVGIEGLARGQQRVNGHEIQVGEGTVSTFARFDQNGALTALGVEFTPRAVTNPPSEITDTHHCADFNDDGTVQRPDECVKWHEFVIPLPSQAARHPDIHFEWLLLNWNPEGHIPPQVYTVPHFDVHFYMTPIAETLALRPGQCGPEHMRCDQFKTAIKPVPPNYKPEDFENVKAAAPAMGNHLVDPTGPEFQGEPFKRAWIYGSYDGRITFYEEMVTQDYLLSRPDTCYALKEQPEVEQTGYYPTQSCIRYGEDRDRYQVVMEEFRMREASPPDPIPASTGN